VGRILLLEFLANIVISVKEKKMNKPDFKKGDKILCIDDRPKSPKLPSPPLTFRKEYIAKDLQACPKCGLWSVDVGFHTPDGKNKFTRCDCDGYLPGGGIHWCDARRFAKKVSEEDENAKEEVVEMKFTMKEILKDVKISAN